jgi:hypothetical protein
MDDTLIFIVLLILTLATGLNLFLTFRVASADRPAVEPAMTPATVEIGEVVPSFKGQRQTDGQLVVSTELSGQSTVLLFLSSGCPACRQTIPQLLEILPAARQVEMALWIVPADPVHDISLLLGDSPLLEHLLRMDKTTIRALNPQSAVPFYLFIDDGMVARASNYVGDEDWQSFIEQMRELTPRKEAVS